MSHQMQQSKDFSLFQLGNAKTSRHAVNQGQKKRVGRPGFLCKLCFFPSRGQKWLPCSSPASASFFKVGMITWVHLAWPCLLQRTIGKFPYYNRCKHSEQGAGL